MREERARPWRLLAKLAARQHGVVSVEQLRAIGIGRSALTRHVQAGRLHRLHRGVYAVGHPRLTFAGRCMAAVLACGDRAVVSHRSAAILWGVLPPSSAPIEVTFAGYGGRRKRTGIVIHRSSTLTPGVTTRYARVPVTSPARTLMDLRAVLPATQFQQATRRALDLRLDVTEAIDPEPDLTRSELERMFLRLVRDHSLPSPEVNARVEQFEVDFLWRELMLIVETDGYRHHAHRSAFEADRARDAQLHALGYRVLRFTYAQIKHEPQRVVATLKRVMTASAQRVPAPRL